MQIIEVSWALSYSTLEILIFEYILEIKFPN